MAYLERTIVTNNGISMFASAGSGDKITWTKMVTSTEDASGYTDTQLKEKTSLEGTLTSRGYITSAVPGVTSIDSTDYPSIKIHGELRNSDTDVQAGGAAGILGIYAKINDDDEVLVIVATNTSGGSAYTFPAYTPGNSNKLLIDYNILVKENSNALSITAGESWYATAEELAEEIQSRKSITDRAVLIDVAQNISGSKTFLTELYANTHLYMGGNVLPSANDDDDDSHNSGNIGNVDRGWSNLYVKTINPITSLKDGSANTNLAIKGNLVPSSNTFNIGGNGEGTNPPKWNAVYATTFIGDLNGTASNATTSSACTGNAATATYATTAGTATYANTLGTSSNTGLGFVGTTLYSYKSILPYDNNSYNLGGSDKRWNTVYANNIGSSSYRVSYVYADNFVGTISNATNATTASSCSGNSATATRATGDKNGYDIYTNYAAKIEKDGSFSSSTNTNKALLLKSKSGSTLSTVYLSDIIANALRGYGGTGSSSTSMYGAVGSIGLFIHTGSSYSSSFGTTVSGTNLRQFSLYLKCNTIPSSTSSWTGVHQPSFYTQAGGYTKSGTWSILCELSPYSSSYGYPIVLAVRIY